MKRRFKENHQDSSSEDEAGGTGEEGGDGSAADLPTTKQTFEVENLDQPIFTYEPRLPTCHDINLMGISNPEEYSEQPLWFPAEFTEEESLYHNESFPLLPPNLSTLSACLYPGPPSLSPTASADTQTVSAAQSLPDMRSNRSFEEVTPDITADGDDETFRLRCSCAGVYQCTVTGLLFDMTAGGDVVYRSVPWNRSLLAQQHKKPAGPLFDITCLQQCVARLHLPHCEIRSEGGCASLSVAHVSDEGVEFIRPHTETHVVVDVSGFSAYGNVKDEDSPPDPVRALVLLFYRPPADPHPESFVSVLLQPANVVLREVQRIRRKTVGHEIYIQQSPNCKLEPTRCYKLSTRPQHDSVIIQPKKAEFYEQVYGNYFTSFEVILQKPFREIKLTLKRKTKTLWKRRVHLPSAQSRSSEQCGLQLPANQMLLSARGHFVEAVSEPVLKSLLDKLLEKQVITDPEREETDKQPSRGDKARFLIDTMRRKGEGASSEMIRFFHQVDPYLCTHLGLV